jgi:hypothetical protein
MRLFHFSDDGSITRFTPRPVEVPAARVPGQEWLNGPLVWAIDQAHQPLYLFPRDCPRLLVWPIEQTAEQDRERWHALRKDEATRFLAFVEEAWRDRLRAAQLYRYEFAASGFESLADAGMWVARREVEPIAVERLDDLPACLAAEQVELRTVHSFASLADLRASSLHVSAIRMRNAAAAADRALFS